MKLYAVYTDGAAILKDEWFLKSLRDKWELNLLYVGEPEKKYSDFSTLGFKDVLQKKGELILNSVKNNIGNVIIWSDLDIQFFGKCSGLIEAALKENDLLFQSEWGGTEEVNVGFMVIRCNQKTFDFWQAVLQRINSDEWDQPAVNDQSIVNDILRKKSAGIKYGVLSSRFWAKSHGKKPPRNIVLHHANVTAPSFQGGRLVGSMELKVRQLIEVKKLVAGRKTLPFLFR